MQVCFICCGKLGENAVYKQEEYSEATPRRIYIYAEFYGEIIYFIL